MSYPPRRSGFVPDHRAVLVAVGVLALAGIALYPQASNAAQGRNRQITGAVRCVPITNGNAPAGNQDGGAGNRRSCPPGTFAVINGRNNNGRNNNGQNNNLGILGDNCNNSRLQPHDGFQNGNRCVSTAFGEVASAESNPSLLITSAPRNVRPNTAFDLQVSTRNLVRDRFLAAGQGGYYKESAFLAGGITRGHFHTACRMLNNTQAAPAPDPAPAFFVATEDSRGGRNPDTVTVRVSGLPAGLAQCAVWAGDGSHRVPMMQRANQTPAFDVVRINVR